MRQARWTATLLLLLPLSGSEFAVQDAGGTWLAFGDRSTVADWELTLRIRQALAQDADLGPLNPNVEVKNGQAALSGPMPSHYFRRKAEALVRRVPGVAQVRNELAVRPTPLGAPQPRAQRPPIVANLASRIETAHQPASNQPAAQARAERSSTNDLPFAVARLLRSNPRFRRVTASVDSGRVQLAGTTRTAGDRDDLLAALAALYGVEAVTADRVVLEAECP